MQISRRNFIQTAGTAIAVIASAGGLRTFGQERSTDLFPLPAEVYSEPLYSMTAREAEALLGTTFNVTTVGGRSVRLTLTEVKLLERQANTLRGFYGESFSLIFESPQKLKLNQGIYQIMGGGLDMNSVLLVPIGAERKKYEMVVNHVTR
jgi:hypothetical protein